MGILVQQIQIFLTLILNDVDYNYLGPATGSETFGPVFGAS